MSNRTAKLDSCFTKCATQNTITSFYWTKISGICSGSGQKVYSRAELFALGGLTQTYYLDLGSCNFENPRKSKPANI